MSLSLALSSALSGLNVTARGTQLVSDNIANAQTEGYGVRALSLAARSTGAQGSGVIATGILRDVDPALLADLRHAKSAQARDQVMSGFWARVEGGFGMPDEPDGLPYLIDALQVSLQNAAAEPESDIRLRQITQAATDIARRFGAVHDTLQAQRDSADAALAKDVEFLNHALATVADLNTRIQKQTLLGGAPESLVDARQKLIGDISQTLAIQEIPRADGRIMLMGQGGHILVDRTAAQFGITRTPGPEAGDSVEAGSLSRVTLNDRAVAQDNALFSTGRIGAFLEIRDTSAPAAQLRLDSLAHDLVSRFGQPTLDPSLGAAEFGLFSLAGLHAMPTEITGISGKIALNPLADPEKGGALWRLRHGMGLASPPAGMASDNALLSNKLHILGALRALAGGSGPAKPAALHAADTLSFLASERLAQDQRGAANTAHAAALEDAFTARGVDTDAELSKLLALEQAYAANAKVIATVDAMWRTLLEGV